MITLPQGSTGYFVVELFEGTQPADLPEGAELTYTIFTRTGGQLCFRASSAAGTLSRIGTGIYSCFLPHETSRAMSREDNVGELAAWLPDKSLVAIGCNTIDIRVVPNAINRNL